MAVFETLLRELSVTPGMLWVVGGGEVVSENSSVDMQEPDFTDGYATVRAEAWHFHLNMGSVEGIQFVEAEDNFHSFPKLYYVRMSDKDERTTIRFYFPNPWLDDDERPTDFQPEKLSLFEGVRDRYVGSGGVVFVRR